MVPLRQQSFGKEDETRIYGIFKVQLQESNRPGSGAGLEQRSRWRWLRRERGVHSVSKVAKALERVLRGSSDASIRFEDLCSLLLHLGFVEHIRGGHHIFTRDDVPEILNLKP